jgi:DNA-binding transcriptional LysR family regulator
MTLVQLRHFVVLANVGSFVQASAALFLTQPALTRSIHALEEELGGALFDRLGRRISLTPFGDEVLARARRLVSDAGALLSTPLMLHMAEHHPRLQVQISRGRTAVLLHALREQQLDAAIIDIRDMRPSAELKVSLAFELSAGFLVRPDHPLAQRGAPVSIEDVMAFPVASTPLSDEVARILIARYGPQANPDDMVTLRSDETLSIVDVARRSNAIVLTVNAVAADLVRLDVAPDLDATARFGLVTLAKREEAPAIRILREHLPNWTEALTRAP